MPERRPAILILRAIGHVLAWLAGGVLDWYDRWRERRRGHDREHDGELADDRDGTNGNAT